VPKPGVYTLPLGSRVEDAINIAGGPDSNADMERVNLAARLSDEEHVSVPHKGDTPVTQADRTPRAVGTRTAAQPRPPGTPSSAQKPTPSTKININTATAQELQALPGVGPVLAEHIIAYRSQNGPFQTAEDL